MLNTLTAKDDEARKPYIEQMEEVLVRMEDVFNKSSEGKAFFGGDRVGFIDIVFGCYLSWLRVTEKMIGKVVLDEVKSPVLAKWAEAFAADPAVEGLLPETDKLVEYAKLFLQKLAASAATPT